MSKEIKDVKLEEVANTEIKPTVEVKKAEKKKVYRRSEMVYQGRLHIDEQHKKPGKVGRVVNVKPGRIKYLESLGYQIVTDETKIGSGSLSEPGQMGSAVQIDAGISVSQPAVYMEIDEDLYNERQAMKAEDNDAQLQASKQSGKTNRADEI
jgi:hypothetical protein